jgi:hypothetical protein
MNFKPEYIEALQEKIKNLQAEVISARTQRNISLVLNIAFIICVLILGQQIEKLAGF